MVVGAFTLTAVNGDTVSSLCDATGTYTEANGFRACGSYNMLSGIGRFAHVSGAGTMGFSQGNSLGVPFVSPRSGWIEC